MPWLASSLIDQAADILKEDFGGNALWTRAELLKYLDGGVREIARRTGGVRRSLVMDAVHLQAAYTLADDITSIDFLAYAGSEVFPTPTRGLELKSTSWPNDFGTPSAYYQETLSLQSFGLYPKPSKTQTNVISVQSGPWNTASTWDVARVPRILDVVTIDTPHTVTQNSVTIICGFSASTNALIVNGTLDANMGVDQFALLLGNMSVPGSFTHSAAYFVLNLGGSDESGNTGDMLLIAKNIPGAIALETNEIPLNQALESIVLDYILWMAYGKEGDGRDIKRSIHYREKFETTTSLTTQVFGGKDLV